MVAQHRSMFLTGCLTYLLHTLTHHSSSRTSRTREIVSDLFARSKVSVPESHLRSSVKVLSVQSWSHVGHGEGTFTRNIDEAEIEEEDAWLPRELFVEREGDSSQLHRIF
ncbi:hypothetical protein QR685DRAFT_568917 [Neurospora intermedia]|uniref:Secreted protein n=1 Tax=Neurospora intermedia TaxID=5142 RepID=A0ABR3DJ66_NEUIN